MKLITAIINLIGGTYEKQYFLYISAYTCRYNLPYRVIPFTAIKETINNRFVRSFLYYIPYAVLTAMTIPAIFYATSWWVGATAGLLTAVVFALKGKGLTTVAIASCVAVFLVELIRF